MDQGHQTPFWSGMTAFIRVTRKGEKQIAAVNVAHITAVEPDPDSSTKGCILHVLGQDDEIELAEDYDTIMGRITKATGCQVTV